MRDLDEVFAILKEHKLRLNAAKCAFRVSSEKFLGNLVTQRRIKANSEQITTFNDLVSSSTAKEVQKLTRMEAALNRFINKSSNKCHPFFQLLHKIKKKLWNEECELALQQFKEYLTKSPFLSTTDEG